MASVARIVGMLGDLTPAPSDGAIRDRVGARRAAPQSRGELGAALVRSAADAADAKARMEERGVGDARALENLARACAGPQLHDRVEATVVWATERGRVRLRALLAVAALVWTRVRRAGRCGLWSGAGRPRRGLRG